jgi:peptidyl-prolyl cis-trans isomerase SurA
MMRIRVLLISISCVIAFSGSTGPISAEISNRIVAFVNNDIITVYELEKRIEEITGQSPDHIRAQNEQQYLGIRREILEQMVNEKIAQDKILDMELQVTEAEIDSTVESIKQSSQLTQEDLISQLKIEGLTYERFRKELKEDLQRRRLVNYEVNSKTIVTEKQITEYYNEHIDDYKTDGRVHIAGIFLMQNNPEDKEELAELTGKANSILARIRNGEDFGTLAREFSRGPGAEDGGNLGALQISQIDPDVWKIVKELPEGGVTGPILRESSIQIIKLIKREDALVKPLEEVRDSIYEGLYAEEIEKRYASWIKDLREDSYIKIVF